LDFIFKPSTKVKKDQLSQGDLLVKTSALVEVLTAAHQYYAQSETYTHFVVITQSCDLVRRGGDCNAPYITIAAAKRLDVVMQEYLSTEARNIKQSDFAYYPKSRLQKHRDLLERYLNNTESEYFFLPQSGCEDLDGDLVVILRLSIALRKSHYDVLCGAKIAELEDVFQAKLGWLKGNIYSRVATPDVEERMQDSKEFKQKFYDKYLLAQRAVDLSTLQADLLRQEVKKRAKELGRDLSRDEVVEILRTIPTDMEIVSAKVVERLVKNSILDPADTEKINYAKRSIENESVLKSLVNGK
jgi:hypothetical protein